MAEGSGGQTHAPCPTELNEQQLEYTQDLPPYVEEGDAEDAGGGGGGEEAEAGADLPGAEVEEEFDLSEIMAEEVALPSKEERLKKARGQGVGGGACREAGGGGGVGVCLFLC